MYRKLMFLISLVALLGLVNVASADCVWIGIGSFCDANNWDCGYVPGPGEEAWIDCDSGGGDIVIDCDVNVGNLRGPAIEADCNQAMDIVSGDVFCDTWRAIMEGSKTGWVNATGGTLTTAGEIRWNDDGADAAYINLGGDFVLTVGDRIRSGDNDGGPTHITITDNAVVTVLPGGDGYMRIGDDGCGSFTASGNAQITIADKLYFVGRKMSVTADVSGNCEIYVGTMLGIGNPGQLGGKAPASVDMTMSGGTINCDWAAVGYEPDSADGTASLTMTGGLLIIRDAPEEEGGNPGDPGLGIGGDQGSGHVQLDGGEIQILGDTELEIKTTGSLDITGGVLVLDGDKLADVFALVVDGKLTGYGGAPNVKADFNVTNPGKTTVWADPAVDPKKAWLPSPPNGATKVTTQNLELSWQQGEGIERTGRNIVFFGTDCDELVQKAVKRAGDTTWLVDEPLELWKTYYWRVDQFNDDGSTTVGDCWSFTTGCEAILGDTNNDCVVNFDDYADVASTWQQEQFWP